MEQIQRIKQYADHLRLTLLRSQAERFIHRAQIDKPTYLEYTCDVLEQEVRQRQKTDMDRRMKMARLPRSHDLNFFDYSFASGINKQQLQQLRELVWIEQAYNLVLMGPSGIGKDFHCCQDSYMKQFLKVTGHTSPMEDTDKCSQNERNDFECNEYI